MIDMHAKMGLAKSNFAEKGKLGMKFCNDEVKLVYFPRTLKSGFSGTNVPQNLNKTYIHALSVYSYFMPF